MTMVNQLKTMVCISEGRHQKEYIRILRMVQHMIILDGYRKVWAAMNVFDKALDYMVAIAIEDYNEDYFKDVFDKAYIEATMCKALQEK